MGETAGMCVCTHAACVCVLLSCILNLRIHNKIDDSSLLAKPYFFEVWMVSHLLTGHKSKGNYKIIMLIDIKIERFKEQDLVNIC